MSKDHRAQTLEEILSQIDTSDEEKCWPWPGSFNKGRPQFRRRSAAKAVWQHCVGRITRRQIVRNLCGNVACVNYKRHLKLGTQAENMRDLVATGRHGARRPISGENHHLAKLTAADVAEMREERKPRPDGTRRTLREIAADRSISIAQASRVCRPDPADRSWKHVP